jgi:Tol biopolymer transport system component
MNPDGSNVRSVPCGLGHAGEPEWDPDGHHLLCRSGWSHENTDIWVTDTRTGETSPF